MSTAERPTIAVDVRALVRSPTGIGVATRSLLAALARRGRARYVGVAHAPVDDRELAQAGVELEHQSAPLGVLWQQLRLPGRLRRGDVDLFWSPLLTLPWRTPVPSVVTVHDLTPLLFPELHHWKVRWSLRPFLARSLATASRVVADSRSSADDITARFPGCRDRLSVVPMGVDAAFEPATRERVAEIRAELGLPDGYLLYVGTLEPRKNIGRLIDAWLALRETRPETPPLVLAGGRGWHVDELVARVEGLAERGLRYLGRVDDDALVHLYQGATLFAYPSLYEGFGLPPLEAMACGVPTATSERSSLPEVVGDGARTFDPEDVDAIVATLAGLLGAPEEAERLRQRGIERAQRFTWEAAAEQMESVFDAALGAGVSLQSTPTASTGGPR